MNRTRRFRSTPESVAGARRFAAEVLAGIPSDVLDMVQLMVSELATNCVRHARAAFELTVAHAGREVRIEVTDDAGGQPELRSPGPSDPTGRGLQIVGLFSDAWGVEHRSDDSTTVWFTVAAGVSSVTGCR